MQKYMEVRDQINTGDIVLFSCKNNIIILLIQLLTNSKWSHVGMAIRDSKNDVQLVLLSERIRKYDGEIAIRQMRDKIQADGKERE